MCIAVLQGEVAGTEWLNNWLIEQIINSKWNKVLTKAH